MWNVMCNCLPSVTHVDTVTLEYGYARDLQLTPDFPMFSKAALSECTILNVTRGALRNQSRDWRHAVWWRFCIKYDVKYSWSHAGTDPPVQRVCKGVRYVDSSFERWEPICFSQRIPSAHYIHNSNGNTRFEVSTGASSPGSLGGLEHGDWEERDMSSSVNSRHFILKHRQ